MASECNTDMEKLKNKYTLNGHLKQSSVKRKLHASSLGTFTDIMYKINFSFVFLRFYDFLYVLAVM